MYENMTFIQVGQLLNSKWPAVKLPFSYTSKFYVPIEWNQIEKYRKQWLYGGFFGPAATPKYCDQSWECDDRARELICYIRRKRSQLKVATPVFMAANLDLTIQHAVIGFIDDKLEIKLIEPENGEEVFWDRVDFIEMI